MVALFELLLVQQFFEFAVEGVRAAAALLCIAAHMSMLVPNA